MKINKINNTKYINNKTNFKAREYAAVKTITKDVVSELKLYEIGENDTKFLDVMSQRINLEKLAELKNATKRQLFKWKTMINNAIMMAGFDYPQRSFLLTKENRPCGIVSYRELPFDFYIDNKYLVEYDGEQHFIYRNSGWDTEEHFKKTKEHDQFKNQWCKENNIPLIRIPYTQLDNLKIEDLLLETSQFIVKE